VGYTWLGIYFAIREDYPVTFCIATIAFALYVTVRFLRTPLVRRIFPGIKPHGNMSVGQQQGAA